MKETYSPYNISCYFYVQPAFARASSTVVVVTPLRQRIHTGLANSCALDSRPLSNKPKSAASIRGLRNNPISPISIRSRLELGQTLCSRQNDVKETRPEKQTVNATINVYFVRRSECGLSSVVPHQLHWRQVFYSTL